jgi:predicted nucleic acid-binding protein
VSVVVDTSVWVDYFRSAGAPQLDELLGDGLVLLAPVVAAELLSAPLTRAERRDLTALLASLPLHATPFPHWLAVGELRARLAKAGLTVSTPDAHVAQCALDTGALLWSQDAVFSGISRRSTLRLFQSA